MSDMEGDRDIDASDAGSSGGGEAKVEEKKDNVDGGSTPESSAPLTRDTINSSVSPHLNVLLIPDDPDGTGSNKSKKALKRAKQRAKRDKALKVGAEAHRLTKG